MSGTAPSFVIGIDFDNTIACYDELVHSLALELGLIQPLVAEIKKEVRDAIRSLPEGEIQWQKLQGLLYGPRMESAKVSDGLAAFCREWVGRGAKLYVVSHKTEYANFDETQTNLRQSALAWMAKKGFFGPNGLGLSPQDVFWEDTREEKLNRIRRLGCTHFIDDLEEVLGEPDFPKAVEGVLYAPNHDLCLQSKIRIAHSWGDVSNYLLADIDKRIPVAD